MSKILIVDDDILWANATKRLILTLGDYEVDILNNVDNIIETVKDNSFELILLDLHMPGISGREILNQIKNYDPHLPVIISTADQNTDVAMACLQEGADDYITKPLNKNRLKVSFNNLLKIVNLERELKMVRHLLLEDAVKNPRHFQHIITEDKKMLSLFKYAEAIAKTNNPVLLIGETGTGKELFAEAIHNVSGRKGDFVPIDVSGLDDNMFSDALFGHKKGAFTGADRERKGLIEKASDGTLFLDEIGDLHPISQIKLLRLIQTGQYYPLGSDVPVKSKARIVAAINKPLKELLENGFRKDLYYRLSTHIIEIPPLRSRQDDVTLLFRYFYEKTAYKYKMKLKEIDDSIVVLLKNYPFYGNVRELKSIVEDVVLRQLSGFSLKEVLKEKLKTSTDKPSEKSLKSLFGYIPTLKELVDFAIDDAMKETNYNQKEAAKLLGLSRQAFNRRLNLKKTKSV